MRPIIPGDAGLPTVRTMTKDDFSRRDIAFHRETADVYDEEVTPEFAVYHERILGPFLDRVARDRPGAKALDLGCGTAVVTLALARRAFDVVGVDHSPEMLEIGRRKIAAAGLEATLESGDVRALRFGAGEFDCVTIQGLLHHLEELEPCLREAVRVLRPGGFLYVSEPMRDVTPVKRLLLSVWSVLPGRRHPPAASHEIETVEEPLAVDELRRALDDLGLSYELRFLTHVPPLRRALPDGLYLTLSRALSFPWRRRQGDLVFVFARKRA
jgi:2-polyprenyl-3-methyl-5-hydroxy-6-metoxy-1,4-benzoquinol methylase